jgi:hypothetical protein
VSLFGRVRAPYVHPRFGECRNHHPQSMPRRFDRLAVYNAEITRGLMHSEAYQEEMAMLQAEFREWHAEMHEVASGRRQQP